MAHRSDLGDLASHLTNTCHLKRDGQGNATFEEEDAVRLLSELPQASCLSCARSVSMLDPRAKVISDLPQMLAEEGMGAGEAQHRVQQATADMHAILGTLCFPGDFCAAAWA